MQGNTLLRQRQQTSSPLKYVRGRNEGDTIRVDWHPRARVLAWIVYP